MSKLAVGFAALSVLGCGGGGSSPPAKQTATGAVTPEAGGTVKLADDSVQLNVPPGAVPADTTITMTTTDKAAPQGITAVSPILQFEPDGTVFQKPVTVTFTFKNATNPVVFWSNSTGGYDLIEGTVTGSTIAAPVMHFSTGFVGERPAGGTAQCGDGVACTAGATCGFGGTAPAGGSTGGDATGTHSGSVDASAPAGGSTSGGSTSGGAPMGGAATDASATDPGGHSPSAMSALSSSAPSSAAVCCSCGADAVFHCSLCQGSVDGADGGASASPCVEGGICSAPGSGCGVHSGGTATGGGTNTAAPMSGSATPDGTGSTAPQGGSSVDPGTGGASYCCTCGSDGHYHCDSTCSGPTSGGVDASATGTGGGADGGTIGGGGSPAQCVQGGACQPGGAPCRDASPTSCTMCMCDSGGTLQCVPCSGTTMADGGTGGGGSPAQCVQGAVCDPASAPCKDASPTSCTMCTCGSGGTLQCAPCPGTDGGVTASDAGAGIDPAQCNQGLQCPTIGAGCGSGPVNGLCTKCMCGSDHLLACQQMPC